MQDKGKGKERPAARKGKFNTKTFAVSDGKNIWVTVPVLLYSKGDSGYPEMAAHFDGQITGLPCVPLETGWCLLDPMNSNANTISGSGSDDDDDPIR